MNMDSVSVFCLSVDGLEPGRDSPDSVHRQHDLVAMLRDLKVPSNWTMASDDVPEIPDDAEVVLALPREADYRTIVMALRNAKARLSASGHELNAIVGEPWKARLYWEPLVRQGVTVVRPYRAEMQRSDQAEVIRGGLWVIPISCSFVGGARQTVRSLTRVCQRKLLIATQTRTLFHVHVDLSRTRHSWPEERDALRSLLLQAYDEKGQGSMRFANLSEVPHILRGPRSCRPQHSILRAA